MRSFYYIFLIVFIHSCNQSSNTVINLSHIQDSEETIFLDFIFNPNTHMIKFYWKNDNDEIYGNAGTLKKSELLKGNELIFATNGGMYLKNQDPQGLYIENGKVLKELDTIKSAYGNFYMQPNGVFGFDDSNKALICKSTEFKSENVKLATQSGPMLIIDGQLHPKFNENSSSKYVRNGVGILPNGNVLFVMSTKTINFYDFATYFKNAGCQNALYLDGFVSRTYLPSKKYLQTDGDFGVMIGVTKRLD